MFAILDLIQIHTEATGSDGESIKVINHVLETAVKVARDSRYSYLRCKAFEVLATLKSRLPDLPGEKVRIVTSQYDTDTERIALEQWIAIQEQVENMQNFLYGLRGDCHELTIQIMPSKIEVIIPKNFGRSTPRTKIHNLNWTNR